MSYLSTGKRGFDGKGLRKLCFTNDIFANIDLNKRNGQSDDYQTCNMVFDDKLYKKVCYRKGKCLLDSFKTILIRFTIKAQNWLSLHYIALTVRLLKKSLNEFITILR